MNFLSLDLNLLRVFDTVMVEQNLTRAADKLAMTQPAVSNALKRLRLSLKDELLVRTAYGVKPTARAEAIWPAIRQALSNLEAAIAPSTFDIGREQATFRMAMADATAALWMPGLMRAIEQQAPGLNIRLVPLITREPQGMLIHGDIDLAMGIFPGAVAQLAGGQAPGRNSIQYQRMYSGHYVCVMSKDHPLAQEELTLDNYCAANHLLVSFSGRALGLVDDALHRAGRQRRTLLTVNQFFTAGKVVANSDLLTVLPYHLIESTGMSNALIWKPLPFEMPTAHIDMLWHERNNRNLAHQWLRDHLSTTTKEMQNAVKVQQAQLDL